MPVVDSNKVVEVAMLQERPTVAMAIRQIIDGC